MTYTLLYFYEGSREETEVAILSRLHLRRTVTLDEGIGELRQFIFPLCYEKPISGIRIYLTSIYIKLRSRAHRIFLNESDVIISAFKL